MVNYKNAALDRTFGALADPTRRALVARLSEQQSLSVSELARPFPVSLPAVMKHLDVLSDAGLITRTKSGRIVSCALKAPPMEDAMIAGDYEHQTGWQILNEFQRRGLSPSEVEMVLLANHAPFTWGKTVDKAVYNSAVLEEIARMAYLSCTLRPQVPRLKDALIRKHYERKHGANSYYGQS